MGISGDDARIQLQKMTEVDQVDKSQQQVQRGEAGAVRDKVEQEREQRKTQPNEMERPDRLQVRQSPHRKKREEERKKKKESEGQLDESGENETGAGKHPSLDIKA